MPAVAGDEAGRLRTADITASSSARTVTVGSLSPVEAELFEESTDLDSDELYTLTSARAVFIGRRGGVGTGRVAPVGACPGINAAADGRRVELEPVRGGWIAAAAEEGDASAMGPAIFRVVPAVEVAGAAATAGAGRGARCRSSSRGGPWGRRSTAPPPARDADAADERPASFRSRIPSRAGASAWNPGEEH